MLAFTDPVVTNNTLYCRGNMSTRHLSRLFIAAAFKRLTVRDVKFSVRSGHILLDAQPLIALFGANARAAIPVGTYWFNDEGDAIRTGTTLRWSKHHRADEGPARLAFAAGEITDSVRVDNAIFIATMRHGPAILAVVRADSTIENQLCWLFGMADAPREHAFVVRRFPTDHDTPLDYGPNYILRELFINPDGPSAPTRLRSGPSPALPPI